MSISSTKARHSSPSLTKRIASGLLALLFFTFAAVQYNDPDGLMWILLYGYVGVMGTLAMLGRDREGALIPAIVIFSLYFIYLTPSIVEWMGSNDSLVGGTMSDDKMYIERSREAFGLLIGLSALLFLWFTRPR